MGFFNICFDMKKKVRNHFKFPYLENDLGNLFLGSNSYFDEVVGRESRLNRA